MGDISEIISPCDVSEVKPPVICPVFFVDDLGKLRLVHYLKWLNARLDEKYFPVWFETLHRIRAILPLKGWMTTADFSSAYFHVPLTSARRHHLILTTDWSMVSKEFKAVIIHLPDA